MMRAAFDRRRTDHPRHAQRHRRRGLRRARRGLLRLPVGRGPARADRCGGSGHRPAPSWPSCASTRPRWRWCPARRSARPGSSACPTPWATTTWSKGCPGWPSSSPKRKTDRQHQSFVERGERRPAVARVLVTEKIAQTGLDLMARAGHEVDVQEGVTPEELLGAIVGRPGPHHPIGHAGHGRRPRGRHRAGSWSAGPGSGSTTSTSPPPPSAASWWSTPRSPTSSRRPSRPWPCCWPRPATFPRPTPPWWRGGGSVPSGRAWSSTARSSAWSASVGSARWWPSGPWPSAWT